MTDETDTKKDKKSEAVTDSIYSIVATTRGKYFGIAKRSEKSVMIESAYELNPSMDKDPQSIAKGYLKGKLYGDNRGVELSNSLVESVTEAPDETRILKTYEALIPEAEKRALGVMTYKALEDLLSK